jgi:hypothetical protein
MATWSKALDALLSVLENPWSEKGYNDLKIQYEILGMMREATALQHLIDKKFTNVSDNSTINKE